MPPFLIIPWFKATPWVMPFPVIDELKLQPFGLLVAIGILFGTRVAEWRAERTGVPPKIIADFLVHTIVIGLISAYFLNALFYKPADLAAIAADPLQFFKKYLGLSSYGGFLGAIGAAFWFRHKRRVSIMVLGDISCFAFPFAWVICRSGCFVVHDHPGIVSDFVLAIDNYNLRGAPRHDLGLYEVMWSAATITLFLILARSPRPRGYFMALLPICYAPIRFFLDFLRETPDFGGDVRYFGLTPGQYGSVVLFAIGLAVAYRMKTGVQPESWSLDGEAEPATAEAPPAKSSSKRVKPKKKRKKR